MPLAPQLQESAIDCHEHQFRHFVAAAARALPGQLLSFGTTNMCVESGPSRVCNPSIRRLLTRQKGIPALLAYIEGRR
jgi:hypothetical protein